MNNSYPEKPTVPSRRTTVAMTDVIAYLRVAAVPDPVKFAAYVIFRNESSNGQSGINNNYVGAQADSGRWSIQDFDDKIAGVAEQAENGTGRDRLFLAFTGWEASVDFLLNRVAERGLYVGGETHQIVKMAVTSSYDLAIAYRREWVTGSAAAMPTHQQIGDFQSMYAQGCARIGGAAAPLQQPAVESEADTLMAAELTQINQTENPT